MAIIDLSSIFIIEGSASSILVGEDISVGDIICKPNIPGPALAYKAEATADANRDNVLGISVTSTNTGGQCFYVRRGAVVECSTINNTGNDTSYWLSDTPGKMGNYADFADGGSVVMIAEAWVYGDRVKLAILDYKKRKETPLPTEPDKPNAPTLSGTPGTDSIVLSFSATVPAGASKVYRYIVKRGNQTIYEGPLETCTDTGLEAGTEYKYSVQAVSNSGSSDITTDSFTTTE